MPGIQLEQREWANVSQNAGLWFDYNRRREERDTRERVVGRSPTGQGGVPGCADRCRPH
jgi:hypothetical protein